MLQYPIRSTREEHIPSNLLQTYVQYKQDTKAVIGWLVSHGTIKYKRMRTLSIKDLFSLAEIVSKNAITMPDLIDFHFRQAIAARTQLSKHFRRQSVGGQTVVGEETVNHEHFTTRYASSVRTDLEAYTNSKLVIVWQRYTPLSANAVQSPRNIVSRHPVVLSPKRVPVPYQIDLRLYNLTAPSMTVLLTKKCTITFVKWA